MPSKDDDAVKDDKKTQEVAKSDVSEKVEPTETVETDSKSDKVMADTTDVKASNKSAEKSDTPDDSAAALKSEGAPAPGKKGLLKRRPNMTNARPMLIKVLAGVIALVCVIVIVFGVLIYGYRSENSAVKVVASVVPYPVERVNNSFVTYNSYLFEVEANKRAYQNNAKLNNQAAVDFKSADGKKLVTQIKEHALEKLANDALTAQLASQKKVKVTDKEVNELIDQLYKRYGGKDTLLKTLNDIYGWKIDDLKSVIRKQILAKNLETKITSDPAVDAAAKKKAAEVEKKIKDGGDFLEIAKKYSQASDAATGGDLGFFTKGQLPDDMQKAAEALQPGQVSDPIKDQYGYEILKVVEKKEDGSIHAQHILIKTVDFTEYFQGEVKKAKISKFIKA